MKTNQPDSYQSQDFVNKFIGLTAYENKADLIALLRKHGVTVKDEASPKDVITMTYVAIAKSPRFKQDIAGYMQSVYKEETVVGQDGQPDVAVTTKKQTTKVGNLIRSVATEQNIGALLNFGLGTLSQKMTAKADTAAINAAAQLEAAKAQTALAEAQKADAQAKQKKWLVPVIIGVVVIAGIATYFIVKKKK